MVSYLDATPARQAASPASSQRPPDLPVHVSITSDEQGFVLFFYILFAANSNQSLRSASERVFCVSSFCLFVALLIQALDLISTALRPPTTLLPPFLLDHTFTRRDIELLTYIATRIPRHFRYAHYYTLDLDPDSNSALRNRLSPKSGCVD
jgi:hypothetical protein